MDLGRSSTMGAESCGERATERALCARLAVQFDWRADVRAAAARPLAKPRKCVASETAPRTAHVDRCRTYVAFIPCIKLYDRKILPYLS